MHAYFPQRYLLSIVLLLLTGYAHAGWFDGLFKQSPTLARMGQHEYKAAELEDYLDTLALHQRELVLADRSQLEALLRSDVMRSFLLAQAKKEHWHENPALFAQFDGAQAQGLYAAWMRYMSTPVASFPPERRIVAAYAENKQALHQPGKVSLRQIYLAVDAQHPEQQVREQLESIRQQVESERGRFGELAKKYSQHEASAVAGGELGWSQTDQLIPAMLEALNQSRVGDLIGPIRSPQGWHLIELMDAVPSRTPGLEEVRAQLRAALLRDEQARLERDYLQGLLEMYPPVVDTAQLHSVVRGENSEGSSVISRMGTFSLTRSDLEAELAQLADNERRTLLKNEEALRGLITNYTLKRYVISLAKMQEFDESPAGERGMRRGRDDAIYLSYLKIKADPEQNYPSQALLKKVYQQRKNQLGTPARYRLAQIYLADGTGQRQAEAEKLTARVRKTPSRFSTLAGEYSDHEQSAAAGGEFGWVNADRLLPVMRDALAKQRAPAIIGPIRTGEGWHILQLHEVVKARVPPFEQVVSQLRDMLRKQKLEQNQQHYLQGVMERYSIEIHQAELNKLLAAQ